MDNGDGQAFLILILIGFSIWLYTKLKKERKQRDKLQKENSKLIADNALQEAEHLKFQLQPHTLNNIFANLKAISNNLNQGMESLSEILEYILYKGNAHLVSVQDELNFIKKYVDLNKAFITEIDSIKVDDSSVSKDSKFLNSTCIPHLISAYFIENAFKHGDVNHPEFLRITLKLSSSTFEMGVTNKIRKKPSESNGGLGLANMRKRLDLLLGGRYEIKSNSSGDEHNSNLIIHLAND